MLNYVYFILSAESVRLVQIEKKKDRSENAAFGVRRGVKQIKRRRQSDRRLPATLGSLFLHKKINEECAYTKMWSCIVVNQISFLHVVFKVTDLIGKYDQSETKSKCDGSIRLY